MGKMRLSNNLTVKTSIKTRLVVVAATGISIALICGICIYLYFNLFDARDSVAQNDGYFIYNFDGSTGTHQSGSSSSFLPQAPSGTARVSVSSGGRITLAQDNDSDLGSVTAMSLIPSANKNGLAKMSISEYDEGGNFYTSFYVKFSGHSGEWVFAQGAGESYKNSSEINYNEVFSGVKFVNSNGKISVYNLKNKKWDKINNTELVTGKAYYIAIYGNNTNNSVKYNASSGSECINHTVGNGKWDLWIDHNKVGANLNSSQLSKNEEINAFMFYGHEASSQDVMSIFNITYANKVSTSNHVNPFQPENLAFSNIMETSIKLSFDPAPGYPDGYIVLRKEDTPPTAYPQDFTGYSIGDIIGDAVVAHIGQNTNFTDTELLPGSTYYYHIFTYTGMDNCRIYSKVDPLKGNQSTLFNSATSVYRTVKNGHWDLPETWEYEYAPGLFKRSITVPTKNNRIIISNGHTVTANSVDITYLQIEENGTLIINGSLISKEVSKSAGLHIHGNLQISEFLDVVGTIQNGEHATISFNGNSSQSIPAATYQNLVIQGGEKILTSDIYINKSINLKKGVINTGSHVINLAPDAKILNENNENYIAGKVQTTAFINGDSQSFGNLGVTINAMENYQNLGNVKVIRTTGQEKSVSMQPSLKKSWHIIPEIQPELEVNLTINWFQQDETADFTLTSCQPWKSVDGGNTWEQIGSPQNASSRSITIPVSSFSAWTIGNGLSAMPVRFIEFKSEESASGLKLKWSTAIEINNMGFEVERSYDAKNYEKIGFVDGNGTTNKVMSYEYAIQGQDKMTYYRLKQIDYDGKFDYSKIISVKAAELMKMFKAYPNPFSNNLNISINGTIPNGQKIKVDMYDINGNIIFSHVEEVFLMNEILSQEAQNIPGGRYILHITYENKTERINLLKK